MASEPASRAGHTRPATRRFHVFLPCGTMFPHGLTSAGHVAAWRASDRIRAAEIKTRGRHGGDQLKGRLTRQNRLSSVEFEARQSRRRRPMRKKREFSSA